MAIYVKVNDVQYPVSITGKINDKDWNNRSSKAIRLEMAYIDAANIFTDDIDWSIVQEVEETVEYIDENENVTYKTVVNTEIYDNSEYSIAGDIVDHRDGTVTVKMGKPTAEELLSMIVQEVLA